MRKTFALLSGMPYGKTQEEHRAYMKWWRSLDREHYNKKRLEWANTHRERRTRQSRASHIKSKFGITIEDYEALLIKQNYRCIICGAKLNEMVDVKNRKRHNLCIDHNHQTNEICGLLCISCNIGIGCFYENPDYLLKAIEYLRTTRC